MLPKENRIPSPTVKTILRVGRKFQHPAVHVLFLKNNLSMSRFAFIVSAKIDKRATGRNRIRRLLQESIRSLLPTIKSGFDVVLIVKRSGVGEDISQTKPMLQTILASAGLL